MSALREIDATQLSRSDVELLIAAALGDHAELNMYPATPNEDLIRVLWADVPGLDPTVLVERFDAFDFDVRPSVLRALAHQTSAEALSGLNRLLLRCVNADLIGPPRWPVLLPLEGTTQDPAAVLDGLIALMPVTGWEFTAGSVILAWAKSGRLDQIDQARIAEVATPLAERCLSLTGATLARGPLSDTYDDEDYSTHRSTAGLMLDLLGHLAGSTPLAVLRKASGHADPWIALWGVRPLLDAGEKVPPADVERIVADPEARNVLISELLPDHVAVVPGHYRTQQAIAESDMVRWLTYPTELGRPPDQIELVGQATLDDEGQPADLFVFRFLTQEPHWSAGDGWMVGVAGPYRRAEQPTVVAGGLTFSEFSHYDAMTPAEHVEALVGTVTGWYEAHGGDGQVPTLQSKPARPSAKRRWFGRKRF